MKKSGILALSILLLLAIAMPVVSAGNYENMEVVANTTSDESGYYSFEEIPNGNYTLVSMNYSDKWRKVEADILVNGSSVEQALNLSSRGVSEAQIDLWYDFLERSSISGQTFKKSMSLPYDPLPYSDVLLLNE
uniref:hypothetical protein n=1 Tax=Methanococcoides sp. NM1 TaxID=1201013 RepID=UPI001AEF9654